MQELYIPALKSARVTSLFQKREKYRGIPSLHQGQFVWKILLFNNLLLAIMNSAVLNSFALASLGENILIKMFSFLTVVLDPCGELFLSAINTV